MYRVLAGIVVLVGLGASTTMLAHAQVATGSITSELSLGSNGANVTKLQTLLATDQNIYPSGLITGYYGPLTQAAVTQFQIDYGIDPVGNVGPITLQKINSILAEAAPAIDVSAPAITSVSVAPSMSDATVTWTTNQPALGAVYFSTSPLSETEASMPVTAPTISGLDVQGSSFNTTNSLLLNNLTPDTEYYYVVESTDTAGNVSVTTPATFMAD